MNFKSTSNTTTEVRLYYIVWSMGDINLKGKNNISLAAESTAVIVKGGRQQLLYVTRPDKMWLSYTSALPTAFRWLIARPSRVLCYRLHRHPNMQCKDLHIEQYKPLMWTYTNHLILFTPTTTGVMNLTNETHNDMRRKEERAERPSFSHFETQGMNSCLRETITTTTPVSSVHDYCCCCLHTEKYIYTGTYV